MASATVYAAAGDGYISNYIVRAGNWAACVAGTGTTKSVVGGTTSRLVYVDGGTSFGDITYYNYRPFLPFDLNTIPAGATITAATLNIYVSAIDIQGGGLGSTIYVASSGQSSLTSLATGDYNTSIGTTSLATTTPATAGLTTGAYLSLTLNASGLANMTVGPGGLAKFCIRNSLDWSGTAPTVDNYAIYDDATFQTSEGTNKPYLDITYTPAPVGAPNRRRRPSGLYIR